MYKILSWTVCSERKNGKCMPWKMRREMKNRRRRRRTNTWQISKGDNYDKALNKINWKAGVRKWQSCQGERRGWWRFQKRAMNIKWTDGKAPSPLPSCWPLAVHLYPSQRPPAARLPFSNGRRCSVAAYIQVTRQRLHRWGLWLPHRGQRVCVPSAKECSSGYYYSAASFPAWETSRS